MSKWRQGAYIGIGWFLAMSYPKDDSPGQIALSLAASSFGVLLVGLTAYDIGRGPR